LRPSQLDRRFAIDGGREDRDHLSRGRRLRHALGVRLRLQAQARRLAQFPAAAEAGGDATAETPQRGPSPRGLSTNELRKTADLEMPTCALFALSFFICSDPGAATVGIVGLNLGVIDERDLATFRH
jgi:hypothetical protein